MKKWFLLAGVGVAVTMYLMNRDDVEDTVKKTAKKIRRELEPMEENVTDRLENLAETIVAINKKVRIATRILDAALGRIAA